MDKGKDGGKRKDRKIGLGEGTGLAVEPIPD